MAGGYQKRVGPELIRTVPQPTLVLWGEEDDVLPVEDAYKYQNDLPNCALPGARTHDLSITKRERCAPGVACKSGSKHVRGSEQVFVRLPY